MKTVIKRVVLFTLLLGGIFASCNKAETFIVEGKIISAEGDTLYLEHRGLAGIELLDSTVLKESGTFKFKEPVPPNPEFYQLRIRNQAVSFAVDSTETIKVSADANNLYQSFKVEGSNTNDKLKKIDELRIQTGKEITLLEKNHTAKEIDDLSFLNQLDSALKVYKTNISSIILGDPSNAAAYYAVFQKINDYLIYDPYSRQDYAMFGAVATSWDKNYPGTERTTHLHNFTINALQTRRKQEQHVKLLENIPVETESGLPDISLPGINGEIISLSSLKGKVVLLDFSLYNAEFSPKHNIDLNVLYNRYKSQNFEIFQVSLDSDEHFWKTSASNLPWVTVRDPRSVNTHLLSTFNIRAIPAVFIVNREGDIIARVEDMSQLSEQLKQVL